MNVQPMMRKVRRIANPMVRKSSLPDLDRFFQLIFHCIGVSAFNKLDGTLKRDPRGGQQ